MRDFTGDVFDVVQKSRGCNFRAAVSAINCSDSVAVMSDGDHPPNAQRTGSRPPPGYEPDEPVIESISSQNLRRENKPR